MSVQWVFLHTGGLPLNSITVNCTSSDDDSISLLYSSVNNNNEVSLGPVTAGLSYNCSVIATNDLGSNTETSNTVISMTGKHILCMCI